MQFTVYKSFCLQVIQGIIYLALGSQYDIEDTTHQRRAVILNNLALSLGVATTIANVIIGVFDIHDPTSG
jgi:hypothetical protein